MEGVYFDGKSSKSELVKVSQRGDGLHLGFDNGTYKYWDKKNLSIESLSSSDKVLVSYGTFPFERLELSGSEAKKMVAFVNADKFLNRAYQTIMSLSPIKVIMGGLGIILVVIYFYITWFSPFVGERVAELLPQSTEITIGNKLYNSISSEIDIDSIKSEKLMDFYQACGFESTYPIQIDYADEDLINAFAVPGGRILIYDGIIQQMESWEELAALMGHELAHVNERHSFIQLARTLSGYLIISALTGDVGGLTTIILENANQFYQLSFSRSHETEADEVGMEYLRELQIRPDAMIDLFSRLEEKGMAGKFSKQLEYLSTHPLSGNRMKHLLEIISENDSYQYEERNIPDAMEIFEGLKRFEEEKVEPIIEELEPKG